MATPIDREVLAGFIDEARSYLPTILGGIEAFHREPGNPATLADAHRLAHSIKGAASMVGLAALSHIAHFAEEVLEEVAEGETQLDRMAVDTLTQAVAQIESYLDGLAEGHLEERPLLAKAVGLFRRLRGLPTEGDEAEVDRLLAGAQPPPLAPPPRAAGEPPDAAAAAAEEASPELREAFLDEAEDHLQTIARLLRELEADPAERQRLGQLRRSVHTLKGAAAMVGFGDVGRLAHRMEDLLDRLFEGSLDPSPEAAEILQATSDAFEDLLRREGDPGELRRGVAELYERFDELLGEEGPEAARPAAALAPLGEEAVIDLARLRAAGAPAAAPAPARPQAAPPLRPSQLVRVPIERLDELVRLVSELVVNRSTFEQHFGHLRREVGELGLSLDRLRRISGRLETEYEVATLAGSARALRRPRALAAAGAAALATPAAPAFDPPELDAPPFGPPEFDDLEFDRYTEFHLLTRELTETGSDISTVTSELVTTIGDFDGYLGRLERLTSEVQDKLMRLRMVPVAQLTSRLHRAVRVTANQQGKKVDLAVDGEEVELDKTVLEEIADPLLHLMRNAVDHGIEPPALRQAVGKPERGRIRLQAYHEGTQVVLQVSDDGAGIEPSALRAAAVGGGYLSETEAAEAADEDLHALLFLPGFSTAGEISEVSGRGVGLDVVKAAVVRNEGSLAVETAPGAGTTFTIRLPMTLAITRVLMVTAAGQTFAVPLGVVRQILRLEREEVERVGSEAVITVEATAYPLLRLADALGLPDTTDDAGGRLPVLILDLGERRYGLAVDRLIEAREVVVKTLGSHLRRVRGITGATLTGDGGVVLILNPSELAAAGNGRLREEPFAARIARRLAHRPLEVLIVDDSLSVRRVLSNLVRSAGWTPLAARDGVEALERIQRSPRAPDVILLDIEMPRMDGYELAASLKGQQAYRDIPIVMITSRAGDKHRRKALDLGVDDYLVKPYQDEVLLNVIRRVTRPAVEARAR
jgi:chemosensory pili system protein ChpA (sensor histidine kinase/response regulator)